MPTLALMPAKRPPQPALPPATDAPPLTSPIIDANYRIHAADLQGAPRHVEIANITLQGVEAMTPVLHLVGQTKRLVMTPENVAQMVEITGTVLMERWIGTAILLAPQTGGHTARIDIKPITRRARGTPMPAEISDDERGWILSVSVVGVILAISTAAVLFNLDVVLITIEQVLEYLPLR